MTKFGIMDKQGEVTETVSIDLNTVPSKDPLAFMYGVHSARRVAMDIKSLYKDLSLCSVQHYLKNYKGKVHGSNHSELALEYLRGFKYGMTGILLPEGSKIRKGSEFSIMSSEHDISKRKK